MFLTEDGLLIHYTKITLKKKSIRTGFQLCLLQNAKELHYVQKLAEVYIIKRTDWILDQVAKCNLCILFRKMRENILIPFFLNEFLQKG